MNRAGEGRSLRSRRTDQLGGVAGILSSVVHSDRKSRPLKELDIIISITKRDDISAGNPEHFSNGLGPDRFIDVGRRYLQDFIFLDRKSVV